MPKINEWMVCNGPAAHGVGEQIAKFVAGSYLISNVEDYNYARNWHRSNNKK